MPNSLIQRIGHFTRAIWYPEITPGTDPGSPVGVVLNTRDAAGYSAKQGPDSAAPVYKGNARPDDASFGGITASGPLPMWLDFVTCVSLFKAIFGATAYTRIPLFSGSLHRMTIPAGVFAPVTGQVQYEFLQTSTFYERLKYTLVKSLGLGLPVSGSTPLDVEMVGSGDTASVDLAGTKTDLPFAAASAFNASVKLAGLMVTGLKDFKLMLDTGASAEAVAANNGIAGSVNTSNINVKSDLTMMLAASGTGPELNATLKGYGTAQTTIPLDVLWGDGPILTTITQWLRILIPKNLASWEQATPGGKGGKTVKTSLTMVDRGATIAGEAWNTIAGPWLFTALNNVISIKVDGGATIDTTLGTGSLTAAAVVTLLNAAGPFTAAATADVYNGRVRITSKQVTLTGATSSVQFVVATANSAATIMGWVNTVIPGFTSCLLVEFYNSSLTDAI